MNPCPTCGALMFSVCRAEGHGAWCSRCAKALSCPKCQRGESTVGLVLACASIFAFGAFLLWAPRLLGGH